MLLKKRTKSGMLDQSRKQSGPSNRWLRSQNLSRRYFEIDIANILVIFGRFFPGLTNLRARDVHTRYFAEILIFSDILA